MIGDQLELLSVPPGPPAEEGGWSPIEIGGRAYRWRWRPELLEDGEAPEVRVEPAGHWAPRRGSFELQYRHDDGAWRDVRYVHRRDQVWNLVRTLPGMPGDGS